MFSLHSSLFVTMALLIVLTSLLQVVLSESFIEVSGYVDDNITLPSNADSSWNLSKIEWSIFSNNTWIATYDNKIINTQRVSEYENRLKLDVTTGNLTIRNLRMGDARVYTVDLSNPDGENTVNTIRLTVKQRLPKPIIVEVENSTTERGCFMVLSCSSPEKGVDFSWHVEPSTLFVWSNPKSGLSQLTAYLNTTHNFTFTCFSSMRTENATQVFMSKCKDKSTIVTKKTPQERDRCVLIFIVGVLFGLIPSCLYSCCPEFFKAAWQSLKEKLFPE
ncbi:CD48 antigen [Melanotaenia boesemani]|uniref:CD48 antigen n=1 Tax=Melanotaenia boesemani TaxID=1250792 RepID=UPI001C0473DF|nr:CD48 antigen [Melanotaenia boesemani]